MSRPQNQFRTMTTRTINPLIAARHSPRAFSDKPVTSEQLELLFEAARWAASSYNAQPWRFVFAHKGDAGYDSLFAGINDWNQSWAKTAPAIVYGVVASNFGHNNQPNRHAWYDLGAAVANLSIQATELDLVLHQMAGIHPEKVQAALGIPEGFEVVVAFALGYKGDPASLPEDMQAKEGAPRQRMPLSELVFEGRWGG